MSKKQKDAYHSLILTSSCHYSNCTNDRAWITATVSIDYSFYLLCYLSDLLIIISFLCRWAELALSRTGSIEAAVHFCLERGADMERLIAEETNRGFSTNLNRRRALNSRMNSSHLISQLVDMGFPRHWCVSALSATSNNVDDALTWILTNGDRLAAEAEDRNEDSEDEVDNLEHDGGDSDDASVDVETVTEDVVRNETMEASLKHVETTSIGWHGSMCPIRFVSGKSKINAQTLEIAGLKDGGFSSVGTKGILLTSGKW